MAEIYTGSTERVYLDVYGTTAVAVTARLTDEGLVDIPLPIFTTPADPSEPDRTRYGTYIGLQHTQAETDLTVTWTFTIDDVTTSTEHHYSVITPYVNTNQVRDANSSLSNMTDQEITALERRVRLVINAYCGTSFGRRRKTLRIVSRTAQLTLPENLIIGESVRVLDRVIPYDNFIRSGVSDWDNYNPKTDSFDGVIRPPATGYAVGEVIEITGIWGYKKIPTQVEVAATILINDYSCDESLWRDRYISAIRAADWRFDYNSLAFQGTGNVQADQLLNEYRNSEWAVV